MRFSWVTAVLLASVAWGARHVRMPGYEVKPASVVSNSTFEQLVDHVNPSLGTFSQFYFYNADYYKGPGSPIILFTPGEVNITGYQSYASLSRTTGVLAQRLGAAVIVLEHRYWGNSSPFADLSTKNLQYLTLDNAISDLTYFAEHVRPPFDTQGTSRASEAPWVLMGGSYSGALSAWTASLQPDVFWAYHASSAPVEAISDYWAYFSPVQQGMPKNCSSDVSLVVDHVDHLLANGSAADKEALREQFGLAGVEFDDDVASALENGPWLWQGNQFIRNSGFFDFCDAIENVGTGPVPGSKGVGLTKALAGYAKWMKDTFIPDYCQSTYGYPKFQGINNTKCFDTHNATSPLFTDHSLSNKIDRQWYWFLCNEPFGYWQSGAPKGQPSLVSRLVDVEYNTRQCALMFPEEDGYTYGLAKGAREEDVNMATKGWDLTSTKRLIWVNGQFDPWRSSGVSSDYRPGGPLKSTPQAPVVIVPGGFHVSDMIVQNGDVNAGVKQAQEKIYSQLCAWVDEHPSRQK